MGVSVNADLPKSLRGFGKALLCPIELAGGLPGQARVELTSCLTKSVLKGIQDGLAFSQYLSGCAGISMMDVAQSQIQSAID
jgi:hypothetical protein